MYCEKCGNELKENATICENCGATYGASVSTKKIPAKLYGLVGGGIAILVFAIIIISKIVNTVHLSDYVSVAEVVGLNGYATVEYEIDDEALCEKVFGEAPADTFSNWKELIEYEEVCEKLLDCIDVAVENNGTFSNGDTAVIEVVFNKDELDSKLKKTIKGGTLKEKIMGLEEGEVIDPCSEKYITIKLEGVDGYGKATFEEKYVDSWSYHMKYTLSETEELSNGDKITLTAEMDEDAYSSTVKETSPKGYIVPQKTVKEIEVKDLLELATADDIADEMIDEVKKRAVEYIKSDDSNSERKKIKVVGVYYRDKLDKTRAYIDSWYGINYYNAIHTFIVYNEDVGSGSEIERCMNLVFENICLDENNQAVLPKNLVEYGWSTERCTGEEAAEYFLDETDEFVTIKLD
ncbi:MAG: zinc ribbon domain-containing protein [Lachnospiraceae bacterium]